MTPSVHPRHVQALGSLLVLGVLGAGFGVPGLLAGLLTAAIVLGASPLYGFVIGQLAIAILTANQMDSSVLVVGELGLLTILWSTLDTPKTTLPVAGLATGGLTAIVVLGFWQTEALWLTAGVLLTSIVAISYALQRYTLVFILEEATP